MNEWVNRQPTCPLDRTPVTQAQLSPAPRILRNLLSRLKIKCDNAEYGCEQDVKLDTLVSHLEECEFNPKRPTPCDQGCSLIIPKDEMKNHNCVRELRNVIQSQQQKLSEMRRELTEQQFELNEQKREINLLKDFMRAMRVFNPTMRDIAEQMERDEIAKWSATLPRARVTRWGGMISTPDELLQVSTWSIEHSKVRGHFYLNLKKYQQKNAQVLNEAYFKLSKPKIFDFTSMFHSKTFNKQR